MKSGADAKNRPRRRSGADMETSESGGVRERDSAPKPKDTRLKERVIALYEETVSEPIPEELLRVLDAALRKN